MPEQLDLLSPRSRYAPQPLAGKDDPDTSYAAAERAEQFIGSHEGKIFGWLVDQADGATYREIAKATGLEPVAVARRLKKMQKTAGVYADGERNRMTIWKIRR